MNDGRKKSGTSPGRYQGLDLEQPLYLGSVPDFKKIQRSTGFDTGFVGKLLVHKYFIAFYINLLKTTPNEKEFK